MKLVCIEQRTETLPGYLERATRYWDQDSLGWPEVPVNHGQGYKSGGRRAQLDQPILVDDNNYHLCQSDDGRKIHVKEGPPEG